MKTWWTYGVVEDGVVTWMARNMERVPDDWVLSALKELQGSGMGLVVMSGPILIEAVPVYGSEES